MNITAANNYSAVYPSLSLPAPAAAARTEGASPPSDRAESARQMALVFAQNAEFYTSKINECASIYNSLTDEFIQKDVADVRAKYGDTVADMELAGMENAKKDMASGIRGYDQALRGEFNISGPTYQYDSQSGTYTSCAFTASVNLGDSAVRFDSTKGPEISVIGSDFTSNFVRNYIPETQYLPYAINPDHLFDTAV